MLMFAVNYYTLKTRFDYEANGYHGQKSQNFKAVSAVVAQEDRLLSGNQMV